MKKKILFVMFALMGVCATASANQEAFYGTWIQEGSMTTQYTFSADEIIIETIGVGSMTISNLIWTPIINSNETAGEYPSGYVIYGAVISVSGAYPSELIGQISLGSHYINSDNTKLLIGGGIVYNKSNDTSDETISADTAKTAVAYYNMMGVQLPEEPESGLYIIMYDNGTTEKRMR